MSLFLGRLAKSPEFGKQREMSKVVEGTTVSFPMKANFSIGTDTSFNICFTLCLLSYLCFITGSH